MKLSLETEGQDCEADHDPDEVVCVVVQISVYAGCQCSRTGLDLTSHDLGGEAEAKENDELCQVENIKSCLTDEGGDVKSRGLSIYLIIRCTHSSKPTARRRFSPELLHIGGISSILK